MSARELPAGFAFTFEWSTVFWQSNGGPAMAKDGTPRSEEHTSELQSHSDLVCRLLLEKKKIPRVRRGPRPSLSWTRVPPRPVIGGALERCRRHSPLLGRARTCVPRGVPLRRRLVLPRP